jgi:ubiquinone/menaquinone biosynthesis C-methylase UbiE
MAPDEVEKAMLFLGETRDTVLGNARLTRGDVVADVGAGTGLLTIGGAGRVGADGDVIAIDISADALAELRRLCTAPNVSYLIGSAEVLPLLDESIDVVLTRSVLIYVHEKEEAISEFFRVLRTGGRCSLFEPLNIRNRRLNELIDFGDLSNRVRDWEEARYANTGHPMLDFDEHDLVEMFRARGFRRVVSHVRVTEQELRPEQLLTAIGAPGGKSLTEEWSNGFSADEIEQLRGAVYEHGTVRATWTGLYLVAEKE